jgi:hypothetical protein
MLPPSLNVVHVLVVTVALVNSTSIAVSISLIIIGIALAPSCLHCCHQHLCHHCNGNGSHCCSFVTAAAWEMSPAAVIVGVVVIMVIKVILDRVPAVVL